MKRYGPLVAAGLVLAAVVIWLGGGILGGPGDGPLRRDAPAPNGEHPLPPLEPTPPATEGATEPADPQLAGAPDARSPRDDATVPAPGPEATPPMPDEPEIAAVYAGDLPVGWAEAEPAQRPHAIRPPGEGRPRFGGGGRGGVGPTGHWTRFPPPPPPRGDADVSVVVADESGRPVPGADLYLGPPGTLHAPAVSFGDLRKIGRTGDDGRLLARDLPAGAAALAGNVANRLNGPRGLDMRSSIPVLLLDGRTVRAELTLPLAVGELGRIAGRVTDAQGRPVRRAAVLAGYLRVYTDDDGRFELPQVPAGPQTLRVSRSGYAPASEEVNVPAGGTANVAVKLELAESGPLRLAGTVFAAEGEPVAGAVLYLIDETRRGTLRSVTTDDAGHYAFEDLPERLATTACRVQAGKHQAGYRAALMPFPDGIREESLDVTLPPRQVRVRFLLRGAVGGAAVTRCRIEAARTDDAEAKARGFLGTNAEGRFEHWYDAGAYRFVVEAPDHRPATVDVTLAGPGETVEVPVSMTATGEEALAITLRLHVTDAGTGEPVAHCEIDLTDPSPDGKTVARFQGGSEDGTYSMPAPSGRWRLRVAADGFETHEEPLELSATEPDVDHHVRLQK